MKHEGKVYFAYGSNLNQQDLERWCIEKGHDPNTLTPAGTAWLPDYELVFDYYSHTRGGGALNIRLAPGHLCPGVLFEVSEAGWELLDFKEDAPKSYQSVECVALDGCGGETPVITYQVTEARRSKEGFVPPSEEYLGIVRAGFEAWDLDTRMLEATARNQAYERKVSAFFVYGTLMRGEERFRYLRRHGLKCALLAETRGDLLDLGNYPGLAQTDQVSDQYVRGEFIRVKDVEGALDTLDEIEGFEGFGRPDSLFRRTLIGVDMCDGRIRQAWTYVFAGDDTGLPTIPSKDWRVHQGKRADFIQRLVNGHANGNEREAAERLASCEMFLPESERESRVNALIPLADALERGEFSERKLAQVTGKWAVVP